MTSDPKAQASPEAPGPNAGRRFEKVILRLVKGGPERQAIEAGQVDAIIDPVNGAAILLPEAQRVLLERKAGLRSLVGLTSDWTWVQDDLFRFVSRTGTTVEGSGFGETDLIGKTLWELSPDNLSPADLRTHRQQLEWRATFRDLELRCVGRNGGLSYLSISGEPIFDGQDEFKGYHGIARDITTRKLAELANLHARSTVDALIAGIGVLDADGVVLLANKTWRACAAGIGSGVPEGTSYLDACDDASGDERIDAIAIAAGIRQVIAGQRERFRYDYACDDIPRRRHTDSEGDSAGGRRWFMLSVTGISGDGAARAVVSREDISGRKQGELLLALEYTVARCLADACSADAALQAVIRAVCETQGWDCGRYFRLDPTADVLRLDESWGIPTVAVQQFLEKSRGVVVRPGAGLKGRVYRSGQPLWLAGGGRDAGVSATALAPATEKDGAFVFPVVAEERTIGVLAFTSRAVRPPDDRMLQTVQSIGSQLGRFLQRQQALDALRRSEAKFRTLTALSTDWCWQQDRDFRLTELAGSGISGAIDVLGKTYWELANINLGAAAWMEHQTQLAEHWSFRDFEFTAIHPDGQLGYYCISGDPVYDDAGNFTGYCGTGMDITERRRAEIALRVRAAGFPAAAEPSG